MICPKCNCEKIRVVDTLPDEDLLIFRRRKCAGCGFIFRTVEIMINDTYAFAKQFTDAERRKRERSKNGK